jgi:hypothetical protein
MKSLVTSDVRVISLSLINVSPPYQRTIVRNEVRSIVKHFDEDAVGALMVGERADGSLWLVDGLQRYTALRELGIALWKVVIFQSRGQAHEAKIFKIANTGRTKVSAGSIFRAALVEGEQDCIDINALVESCGLRLDLDGVGSHWPNVKAIKAVQRVYSRYGAETLRRSLDVITSSWPENEDGLRGDTIEGIATFLAKAIPADDSSHGVRDEVLVKQLRKRNPMDILIFATSAKKIVSSSMKHRLVADVIADTYNHRLRVGKIRLSDR